MPYVDEGTVDVWWQGYAPWVTSEQAAVDFERKYGHPPRVIKRTAGAVLAGPKEGVNDGDIHS